SPIRPAATTATPITTRCSSPIPTACGSRRCTTGRRLRERRSVSLSAGAFRDAGVIAVAADTVAAHLLGAAVFLPAPVQLLAAHAARRRLRGGRRPARQQRHGGDHKQHSGYAHCSPPFALGP